MNQQCRLEDMSLVGRLVLTIEDDGDVIVSVYPQLNRDGKQLIGNSVSVQFCSPGSGGGRSPQTHKALRKLANAMRADNADRFCDARAPKFGEVGGPLEE